MENSSIIIVENIKEMVEICTELTKKYITFKVYKNIENEWVVTITKD